MMNNKINWHYLGDERVRDERRRARVFDAQPVRAPYIEVTGHGPYPPAV